MKDKDILKLKLGLATFSLLLLLTGSKLLFDEWKSIAWSFWLLMTLLAYFGVYRTLRLLLTRDTRVIFYGFETAGTITFAIGIGLATIMLFIFYPLISLLFFGLALLMLSVFIGLRFIVFDFSNNKVEGLSADRDTSLITMIVDINSENNEIEIKTTDRDDILVLKKEKFNNDVWTQLIENFQRVNTGTKSTNA